MDEIKEISFEEWKEKYEWLGTIWANDICRQLNNGSISKFFFWTSIHSLDGNFLIPGIHEEGNLIYQTKKPIDHNVIVTR